MSGMSEIIFTTGRNEDDISRFTAVTQGLVSLLEAKGELIKTEWIYFKD